MSPAANASFTRVGVDAAGQWQPMLQWHGSHGTCLNTGWGEGVHLKVHKKVLLQIKNWMLYLFIVGICR